LLDSVGNVEGVLLSVSVGANEAERSGLEEGTELFVGAILRALNGATVGIDVGSEVGTSVGDIDMLGVTEGAKLT
jgi:hypothetical protein